MSISNPPDSVRLRGNISKYFAYLALAGGLAVLLLGLFWVSRDHFPQPALST